MVQWYNKYVSLDQPFTIALNYSHTEFVPENLDPNYQKKRTLDSLLPPYTRSRACD